MRIMGEVVFVLADTRSGSTLVDQLLGAHPRIFSLGEVHWLAAYVREDRRLYDPEHPLICTCGSRVVDCPFWTQVADVLGKPLDSLQLRLRHFHWVNKQERKLSSIVGRLSHMPSRLIQKHPTAFRSLLVQRIYGGRQLAIDSMALFEAIFRVTESAYLVDSSKLPLRFRAIHDFQPERVRALILGRDYRAVIHSKMKRGRSLEASALGWKARTNQIEALTADVPEDRKFRMKYEALCENPEKELKRICGFLKLTFTSTMLERPVCRTHHIGGSPSKFDNSRTVISPDTSYQEAFTPSELQRLRDLVGPAADVWGY